VRKHLMWASATLVLATGTLSGCGGSPSASSSPETTCIDQSAAHHAYVVVMHASATVVQKCVGFSGDTIDGQSLMDRSGIEFQTQDFGPSLGKAACQIDNEPAQFSKCFSDNGPNWSLFVETGGQWADAPSGYGQVMLHDKEALGWVYTAAVSPSPPPPAKE
jgi:hypothetical protein